jgi:6-phosphogluconolactonase (cycloisomerase 2 family)
MVVRICVCAAFLIALAAGCESRRVPAPRPITVVGQAVTLSKPKALLLSPGGKYAYVISPAEDTVQWFEVAEDGSLSEAGTLVTTAISEDDLSNPQWLAFNPNGRWAYLSAGWSGCPATFSWDAQTGMLDLVSSGKCGEYAWCTPRSECHAYAHDRLAISPDGKTLWGVYGVDEEAPYFLSTSRVYDVDPEDGTLTLAYSVSHSIGVCEVDVERVECEEYEDYHYYGPWSVTASPEGGRVYLTYPVPGLVEAAIWNSETGIIVQQHSTYYDSSNSHVPSLHGATDLAFSADGKYLYTAGDGTVVAMELQADDSLEEVDVEEHSFLDAESFWADRTLAFSHDGFNLFVATPTGIHSFGRDSATGKLEYLGESASWEAIEAELRMVRHPVRDQLLVLFPSLGLLKVFQL